MIAISTGIGLFLGIPLGAFLFHCSKKPFYPFLSFFINTMRSIPYIILVILMIPLTRFCIGTSIGTLASIFPLSLAAFLLIARAAEEAMHTVSQDFLDIGYRTSPFYRIFYIVFPESLPLFLKNVISIIITLIGFSAMSGTVGGGGLGDLALRYGYQRYDIGLIFIIVSILIVMVQGVQMVGNWLHARLYS